MMPSVPSEDARAEIALRDLLELARQLLPLATAADVARDGLLCIAGIRGIGGAAVLWRDTARGAFELLSYFGLGSDRLRKRYRVPVAALARLQRGGPLTLEAARRKSGERALVAALEPLAGRLGDGWVVALAGETGIQGIVVLGRSLVTGLVSEPLGEVLALVDVLRLALLGSVRSRGRRSGRRAGSASARAGARADARLPATRRGVARRIAALRRAHPATTALVGESAPLLAALEQLIQLAPTNYTVLLHGETGTGKELAAGVLHRESSRRDGPFEVVDCSSMPRELIESELFGHVRGAFTGAVRDFAGAFERAHGGTLLLDEIGDMDLRLQTRLLRVLQEGSVRRVGGDRPIPVDVRVVASTHRDLAARVRTGDFRADLYYRIHVCIVDLPPVRERGEDRFVLFNAFMRELGRELGRAPRALTPEARQRLAGASLPGNVRQIQNVVRQLLMARAARGAVTAPEVDRVVAQSTIDRPDPTDERMPRRHVDPADGPVQARPDRSRFEAAPEIPEGAAMPVQDIGPWVLDQLRANRFNVRETASRLQRLRRSGAPRSAVPVTDRGALDYYLCGEFFHRLVRSDFRVQDVLEDLAGEPRLVARVRRRVRAYLQPLADERGSGSERPRAWERVPEAYAPDLERVVEAVRARHWQPPPL